MEESSHNENVSSLSINSELDSRLCSKTLIHFFALVILCSVHYVLSISIKFSNPTR